MRQSYGQKRRERRPPKPLDRERLQEMALAYVARFATSSHKLQDYLRRKLRERGWDEEAGEFPDVAAIAQRYVNLGYIDDEAYARMKSGGLMRRGYGQRRVNQALNAAGIDEETRDAVKVGEAKQRAAALVMARKRRFGPYHMEEIDRAKREKQIAAMLRAGHSYDSAKALIDASSIAAAEEWADPAEED